MLTSKAPNIHIQRMTLTLECRKILLVPSETYLSQQTSTISPNYAKLQFINSVKKRMVFLFVVYLFVLFLLVVYLYVVFHLFIFQHISFVAHTSKLSVFKSGLLFSTQKTFQRVHQEKASNIQLTVTKQKQSTL